MFVAPKAKPKSSSVDIPRAKAEQADTPSASSALSKREFTPTPIPFRVPRPAALKANQQSWEQTFSGAAQGVNFQLRVKREPDGHLHARYQVSPGKGEGWHLEGQLREDNTFALTGTANGALFEGQIIDGGAGIRAQFTNGDFHIGKLMLSRTARKVQLAAPRSASVQASGADADTNGRVLSDEVFAALRDTARVMGKPFNGVLVRMHADGILKECVELGINNAQQIAYVLATALWESDGFTGLTERYAVGWSADEYFEQSYGPNPTKTLPRDALKIKQGLSPQSILQRRRRRNREELGNVTPGDGALFRGRGYVHITGRANYVKAQQQIIEPRQIQRGGSPVNIVAKPELAASDAEIAALLLAEGMRLGLFTGVALDDYVNEGASDFTGARRVINGQDSAATIADGARRLSAAVEPSAQESAQPQLQGQDGEPTESNGTIKEISERRAATLARIPDGGYSTGEAAALAKGLSIGSLDGVEAYYNGPDESVTRGLNYSPDGRTYYGYKWQCVEFVRRYTSVNSGHYIGHRGNAETFYKSTLGDGGSTFDGFKQHRNLDVKTGQTTGSLTKPGKGDIVVIGTATYGHVAVVAEVGTDYFIIAQQNVGTQFTETISLSEKGGRWVVGGRVQCWLSR